MASDAELIPDSISVPGKVYEFTLGQALSLPVVVPRNVKMDPDWGRTEINMLLEISDIISALMSDNNLTSRQSVIATLGEYGRSLFQHKYNPTLKDLKRLKNEIFYSGQGRRVLNGLYGNTKHLACFPKMENGVRRKRTNLYGLKDAGLNASIGENSDFFNTSDSDMAQIMICHALLQWEHLPPDYKEFCNNVVNEFDEHSKKYLAAISMYREGQLDGEEGRRDNSKDGQPDK